MTDQDTISISPSDRAEEAFAGLLGTAADLAALFSLPILVMSDALRINKAVREFMTRIETTLLQVEALAGE